MGFDLKIDKPEPYDNRALKPEKTANKKLKGLKKFFQNLTTHYNYFFNANNKLNEVIDGAKQNYRDDLYRTAGFLQLDPGSYGQGFDTTGFDNL